MGDRRYRVFMGIDPGKTGGIAVKVYDNKGVNVRYFSLKDKTELQIWQAINQYPPKDYKVKAVIEQIQFMFGSSKSSVAKLYGSYMQLRGFLVAADLSFEKVMPTKWQREIGVQPRDRKTVRLNKKGKKVKGETTTTWKNKLKDRAQELFPRLAIWKEGIGKQQAVADALLICKYCELSQKS